MGFIVLKYIGEKESEQRTLSDVVKLWDEYGRDKNNYRADVTQSVCDILSGDYGDTYKDFKELVLFPKQLKNEHYEKICTALNAIHLHGCSFDVFGAIYEEFASKEKKKVFGEFYTRRHITGTVARLLLRDEITGSRITLCDPACGTGGFLTEAFKALVSNYSANGKLTKAVRDQLANSTFWGYDNDEKSVARTKLNMFLVGDGHTHIHQNDTLSSWRNGWKENSFQYILSNPPMGEYKGDAKIENFEFTNEQRYEMMFLERIIKATKHTGEMAVVVPDGMLEGTSREGFRRRLLDNCYIYAIVSLTRFAFAPYTGEKTYVLFMRRKPDEEIGQRQQFPIWHFIVDYDGFANSAKRFRTKYHDDLPELEEKFNEAVRLGRKFMIDPASFARDRKQFERDVNARERDEGLTGKKYGYVEMSRVNEQNFHYLLSEYYLRPAEIYELHESDLDNKVDEFVRQIRNIPMASKKGSSNMGVSIIKIGDVFDYWLGNGYLTEQAIYNQQPTSEEDKIPIFGGSQDNEAPIGFIKTGAVNEKDKKLKYFEGPCLILTKDGSAGLLTYKGAGVKFTINHHAWVLKPKNEWAKRLHLQWFSHQYQHLFFQATTGKGGNRTFVIDWLNRLECAIPDYAEQKRQWGKISRLVGLKNNLLKAEGEVFGLVLRPLKSVTQS